MVVHMEAACVRCRAAGVDVFVLRQERLISLFESMDVNGDGMLNVAEFRGKLCVIVCWLSVNTGQRMQVVLLGVKTPLQSICIIDWLYCFHRRHEVAWG